MLGAVMSCRWAILVYGDLELPELRSGDWRRPLTTIGMRCHDLGILLEVDDNVRKRIMPISDSVGKFVFAIDERDRERMTDDPHVPA